MDTEQITLCEAIATGCTIRRGTSWPKNKAFPNWQYQLFDERGGYVGPLQYEAVRQLIDVSGAGVISTEKGRANGRPSGWQYRKG
jgi:hypothetical protein